MKIDATRYRLFMTNPEEYRIREVWGHVPESRHDVNSLMTYGRRRGSAFHYMTDGTPAEELDHLGESAVETAKLMFEANNAYGRDVEVVWKEQEFDIAIPGSPHRMVGRIDSRVRRYDEEYIQDYKTSKHRTKAEWKVYKDELYLSPQVDFYLLAQPDLRKFVFRILSKAPATKTQPHRIEIQELEVYRQAYELKAFQRSVHMACCTIEYWKKNFGVADPWPRAIALKVAPENYPYAPLYSRTMYPDVEWEGFEKRVEHLDCLKEGVK